MRPIYSGSIQDKLINRLEKKERRESLRRDRFFKVKLSEIHSKLFQSLLLNKTIETDNPQAISNLILQGLNKAYKTKDFDFTYFVAP